MKIFSLDFSIPKRSNIGILDYPGSLLIKKILKDKTIQLISTRHTKINIFVLISSFFQNYKYKKGQRYIISFIKAIKPKILISHIDNNNFFYTLKKIFPETKFIFIQNGISLASHSFHNFKKLNWKTDYFFSYSDSFSKKYKLIFKNYNIKTIGSLKNNYKKVEEKKKKHELVYISQYFKDDQFNKKINIENKMFLRSSFFNAEKLLLPILYEFCLKKNLKLTIAGRSKSSISLEEKKFYLDILKNYKKNLNIFNFKKQNNDFSSYSLVDSAKLVVFIDSALGYQSLARGNKSFACCLRSQFLKSKNLKFGWPSNFKHEGPFWINSYNKKKIINKLEFLYSLSLSEWKNMYKRHKKKLLTFELGNQSFIDTIKKLKK